MTETIEFDNFFNNSGIDSLIDKIESSMSRYDEITSDEVSKESMNEEIELAESLTLLSAALKNIKKMSESSNSDVNVKLRSQIESLQSVIKAHQLLLKLYVNISDEELQNRISDVIHSLNIIYPLFVIGVVFGDNQLSHNNTNLDD